MTKKRLLLVFFITAVGAGQAATQCELKGTYSYTSSPSKEGMEEELELGDEGKYTLRLSSLDLSSGSNVTYSYQGTYSVRKNKVRLRPVRLEDKKKRIPGAKLLFDGTACTLQSKVKVYKREE
jgi:hypothetical protein